MIGYVLLFALIFGQQIPAFTQTSGLDSLPKIVNKGYEEVLESIYPPGIPTLSIHEFKELKQKRLYVLDTRTKEEFEVSHLKNAREVGYYWFDMRSVYDIPKDATVIAYCAVGNRSSRIAEKLLKAGYKNVFILYGGIFEWVNEGNPVYTNKDTQTPQIHGYTEKWSKWLDKGSRVL